jgi:murein DD-endopeptidase MepM/ murein hydrolase activator NlpD
VAYERTRRPDGTTRAIQVLAAEAAVGGAMHTVFLFDRGDSPGYYDDLGRSLDPVAWAGPLATLRVTSPFKLDRMHPLLRRVLPHTGVDFAAGYGTPVRATGDGSVTYAAARGGYGNMVEIQHPNGYATRYAHLSRISPGVASGMPVHQGDVIGYVGASGLATGPHLHYEVRRKGRPVDPLLAQAESGTTRDVGYDEAWRGERRRMGRLLARAPTLVSRRAFR